MVAMALSALSELNAPLPLSSLSASIVTAPPAVVMSAFATLSVMFSDAAKLTVPLPVVVIPSIAVIELAAAIVMFEFVALTPVSEPLTPPIVKSPVFAMLTPPVPPLASRLLTATFKADVVPTPAAAVIARFVSVKTVDVPVSFTVPPVTISSVLEFAMLIAPVNVTLPALTAPMAIRLVVVTLSSSASVIVRAAGPALDAWCRVKRPDS